MLWFTQDQQNISFSINSGYLPVTKSANTKEAIAPYTSGTDASMTKILDAAVETVQSNTLYTTKAFQNGSAARSILENSLSDQAIQDRALVKESLAQGMTLEEAVAEFVTDQHFEAWYQAVLEQFSQLEI